MRTSGSNVHVIHVRSRSAAQCPLVQLHRPPQPGAAHAGQDAGDVAVQRRPIPMAAEEAERAADESLAVDVRARRRSRRRGRWPAAARATRPASWSCPTPGVNRSSAALSSSGVARRRISVVVVDSIMLLRSCLPRWLARSAASIITAGRASSRASPDGCRAPRGRQTARRGAGGARGRRRRRTRCGTVSSVRQRTVKYIAGKAPRKIGHADQRLGEHERAAADGPARRARRTSVEPGPARRSSSSGIARNPNSTKNAVRATPDERDLDRLREDRRSTRC